MKKCGKCDKIVYPTEELRCLDKVWHKLCFKCQECNMTLNVKNYQGFNKMPYCNAHIPKAKATVVAETPETRRIAENTKLQSNILYHQEFEKNKGKKMSVADDPETLRIKQNMATISQVAYKGVIEKNQQMEQRRPSQAELELAGMIPAAVQAPTRRPGSIVDYDPIATENVVTGNTTNYSSPYSQKQKSNTIYTSKDNEETERRASKDAGLQRREIGSIFDYDPTKEEHRYTLVSEGGKKRNSVQNSHPTDSGLGSASTVDSAGITTPPSSQSSPAMPTQPPQQVSPPVSAPSQQPQQQQQQPISTQPTQQEPVAPTKVSEPATFEQHSPRVSSSSSPQPQQPPQEQQQTKQEHIQQQQQQQQSPRQSYGDPQAPVISNENNSANPALTNDTPTAGPAAAPSQGVYQAIYDYDAGDDDEVTIVEGDVIINGQIVAEGWMHGTNKRTGVTGLLPSNYVEEIV